MTLFAYETNAMVSATQSRLRAEASFKKVQAKKEADSEVLSGLAADARAVDEKTAKLRALRLARDAAAEAEQAPEPKSQGKRGGRV